MTEQKIRIIVDKRELRSPVAKELEKLDADLEFDTISVGDYVLSRRVGVERKTSEDFLKTWLDEKKLFLQLLDLVDSYERPILIIEGFEEELYTSRMVHPNAVDGCLNTIALMPLPVRYSLNTAGTAKILYGIASREQDTDKKKYFSWHGKRSHMSANEQKVYVVSAINGLGTATARSLLTRFGNIQAIFNAEREDLQEVENVGPKTAERIREVVSGRYKT